MNKFLLIGVVLGFGCCPAADRELPLIYDHRDDYYLRMAEIQLSLGTQSMISTDVLNFRGVVVEATAEDNQFDVRVTNHSQTRTEITFARASYVDELGVLHSVVLLPGASGARSCDKLTLGRGESGFCSVVPGAKEYKVREGCFADYMYREPLVPWAVASMAPDEAKRVVQSLASSKQKVVLRVPVAFGEQEGLLSFAVELSEHPYRDVSAGVKSPAR